MSSEDELHTLLDAINEERQRGNRIRLISMTLIGFCFGFFAISVYNSIKSFDSNVLFDSLQESSAKIVWPMVSDELDTISKVAVPAISDALVSELSNLGPKLSETTMRESQTFQENMGTHIASSLQRELDMAFAANKERLDGEAGKVVDDPMLKDEMLASLQLKTQQWAQNQLDTTFEEHLLLLQSINETIQSLQEETLDPDGTAGTASIDDLVLIVTELLNERIGDNGGEQ